MNLICTGNTAHLAKGDLIFPDYQSFYVEMQELLVGEDYYFETLSTAPRILDCGSHCGLAIYYFKHLFPNAKITGFEPVPWLRELVQQNIDSNAWEDVELLPYALAGEAHDAEFTISQKDSMAGSLTDRRALAGDETDTITVSCRPLSEFLHDPINFLKLDIEGPEAEVLEEAAPLLHRIENLFCEYHEGLGLGGDRLERILSVLHKAGFDVHLAQSFSSKFGIPVRPLGSVRSPYALSIWAKNRRWPPPRNEEPSEAAAPSETDAP